MTYLEAGNASYADARKAFAAKDYNAAARGFVHAKDMFQKHEGQHGSKTSPAIHQSTDYTRQSIRLRDAA